MAQSPSALTLASSLSVQVRSLVAMKRTQGSGKSATQQRKDAVRIQCIPRLQFSIAAGNQLHPFAGRETQNASCEI